MSDTSSQENNEPESQSNDGEAHLQKRLDKLDEKLRDAKPDKGAEQEGPRGAGLAIAMRMGIEFVVAVLIGGAIGWQLDEWMGTTPFLLFIFISFGFAAGTLNIIRSGKRLEEMRNKN